MKLLQFPTKTIGVDAGSQNLRITHNGNLVFNETCVLSIDTKTNKVSGCGNQSIHDGSNVIIKPVNYVISDFVGFERLLSGALKRSLERNWLPTVYHMYFSVPLSVTEVEKRAYRDAGDYTGAKEVCMIPQPCSSAVGMGILSSKKDFVLIDFGASKVDVAVFANSVPVAEGSLRIGTWKLQEVLSSYIFKSYNLKLSVKELIHILSDFRNIKHKEMSIDEIRNVLNPYILIIEDLIFHTIEKASTHARFDKIITNGCYLTGGGAYMDWIFEKISLKSKMNFKKSAHPLMDNSNGLIEITKAPEKFKDLIMV